MENSENKVSTDPTSAQDRRLYERYDIQLDAVVEAPSKLQYSCSIRNFCIGGLFLHFPELSNNTETIEKNTELKILCMLPGNEKQLSFSCRIVNNHGIGFGVSFIDPDLSALQAFQTYAKSIRKQHQSITKTSSADWENKDFGGRKAVDIFHACNHIIEKNSVPLMGKFIAEIVDHLFETTGVTKDSSVKSACFDALNAINSSKNTLKSNYKKAIQKRLAEYSPIAPTTESLGTEPEFTADSLSLVEDDEFDEWLSETMTVDTIEATYRMELNHLQKRLSMVFGTKIDKQNIPYGPDLFYQASHETIQYLDLKHQANIICYRVFLNTLLNTLGEFYNGINKLLYDSGIKIDLSYKISKDKDTKKAGHPENETKDNKKHSIDDTNTTDANTKLSDNIETSQTKNSNVKNNSVDPKLSDKVLQTQNDILEEGLSSAKSTAKSTANNTANSTAYNASKNASANEADIKKDVNNLYQIVSELRQLQGHSSTSESQANPENNSKTTPSSISPVQSVTADNQKSLDGDSTTEQSVEKINPYSSSDILDALSRLNIDYSKIGKENIQRSYKSQLLSELAKSQANDENKGLGEREDQILDVATTVFGYLQTDTQVADSVRDWITQLEVPLLKVALLDDDLFLDRSHIVRQVVNKISQLELISGNNETRREKAITGAISDLVELINSRFDGSTDVFSEVDEQLDFLINVQEKTYKKNIKQVIEDSRQAFEFEESKDLDKEPAPSVPDETDENSSLKKVSRLQEGNWMLFDPGTEDESRLRIAWIAPNTNRYVFVTVSGVKDRVLLAQELAELLESQAVQMIDNADEPALDRAQYNMLQELHEKILHQSTHDQLTNLINRRELEKLLTSALSDAKLNSIRHALCFIDIDQFNVVNNTCGQEAGDNLLIQLANLFQENIEEGNALARIGSDEFAMILYNTPLEDALFICENQLRASQEFRFEWQEKRLPIAISAGIVPISEHSINSSELFQSAESCCSVAKELGGNRIQVYHSGHAKLSQRNEAMKWVAEIGDVLDGDTLELNCQKIISIQGDPDELRRFEILLRVKDKQGNKIDVKDFVEAAETFNRIPQIDRWVIKNVFQWMVDNPDIMDSISSISINLSGRSLSDEHLIDYIQEEIEFTKVDTEKVCFEITETAGVANLSDAADFINTIKATGCSFSLDDFGSGMSSYAYLKNLPVDYLKIDGAFIKDIANNSSDYAVAKSICQIAHFMGKKVVAEYVENDEILQIVKELGIDYAQGFGIGKPRLLSQLK